MFFTIQLKDHKFTKNGELRWGIRRGRARRSRRDSRAFREILRGRHSHSFIWLNSQWCQQTKTKSRLRASNVQISSGQWQRESAVGLSQRFGKQGVAFGKNVTPFNFSCLVGNPAFIVVCRALKLFPRKLVWFCSERSLAGTVAMACD